MLRRGSRAASTMLFAFLAAALAAALALPAGAVPIVPKHDDDVIEVLPSGGGSRVEERRLRRALAAEPGNAAHAAELAKHYIGLARGSGDPRFAGQALAALAAWPDPATAPPQVLLMQATVAQYLHDFDASVALLERLVARDPRHAQAWLTLATVRRVQGRYADSDRACRQLSALGAGVYGDACLAENQSLRGEWQGARETLTRLAADPQLDPSTRNWLLTTLAETEERAGNNAAAESAYGKALAASPDAYTAIAYADWLIARGRHRDALALLGEREPNDAILLRQAIAATLADAPDAKRASAEMRERMAQANLRPEARSVHAREQAMFALWVERQPARALELARINVAKQREPIDVLLLAQAAKAAGAGDALREAEHLRSQMGLADRRLDAIL